MRKFFVQVLVWLTLATASFGQPGDGGGGEDPDAVPISGIEILITIGVIFGVKKISDIRKAKNKWRCN